MSLELLDRIQKIGDRYVEARVTYDEAREKGDIGAATLHWERLLELEAAWRPLADEFATKYANTEPPSSVNTIVVWKKGAVGVQGIVTELPWPHHPLLATVKTKRGTFQEFIDNLMPLSAISRSCAGSAIH
jgi:hypothetical protein